jgi:drug/metabolite transporter (DMT)-like permease
MLMGLAAAACLATYFLVGERQVTATSPLTVAFWTSGFAAVFWALFSGWWQLDPAVLTEPQSMDGALAALVLPVWMPLIWTIVLGTFLPFLLSFAAIGRLKATAAGILASSEVVFAFAFAWLWLGEALTGPQLVGAAVVLVGIVLAQTARPEKALDANLAFASDEITF